MTGKVSVPASTAAVIRGIVFAPVCALCSVAPPRPSHCWRRNYWHIELFRSLRLGSAAGMLARGPWQAEILAQRRSRIGGAIEVAPLQLRHHQRDELVERIGEE